jgi:predicted P-loop ATPase
MHMLAAITRMYKPGAKYDICLCLVGAQGGGKSTFFRFLALEEQACHAP